MESEEINPLEAIQTYKKRKAKLQMFDVDVYLGKQIISTVKHAAPTPEQAKVEVLRLITFKAKKAK